jgi:hypothetical protein
MQIETQHVAHVADLPAFDHPIGANHASSAVQQAHELRQRVGNALPFALGPGDRRILPISSGGI